MYATRVYSTCTRCVRDVYSSRRSPCDCLQIGQLCRSASRVSHPSTLSTSPHRVHSLTTDGLRLTTAALRVRLVVRYRGKGAPIGTRHHVSTLLDRRPTPRPRPSTTPSAWWSSLINWACGSTRMKTKLRQVVRCSCQAMCVRTSYRHDSSSSHAQWFGLLEPRLSCLAYGHSRSLCC